VWWCPVIGQREAGLAAPQHVAEGMAQMPCHPAPGGHMETAATDHSGTCPRSRDDSLSWPDGCGIYQRPPSDGDDGEPVGHLPAQSCPALRPLQGMLPQSPRGRDGQRDQGRGGQDRRPGTERGRGPS
jgi:hypothetical protein